MDGVDLTAFGGEPERLGADVEEGRGFGEIEPGFDAIRGRAVDRDPMVGSERRHALTCPAVSQ